MRLDPGKIVALTRCPAIDNDGTPHTISGLWELVEFEQADHSVGIFAQGWIVVPEDNDPLSGPEDWEKNSMMVDEYDLWQQADPNSYARMLAEENAQAAYEQEQFDRELAEGLRRLDPIIGFGGDPDFPSVACGDPVHLSDLRTPMFGIVAE